MPAEFQRLNNVCNGGHIYRASYIADAEQLCSTLSIAGEDHAILISEANSPIASLLKKLSKKRSGLRAKKLCKWSSTGTLWIIRS
jgi:hypothetical protein